MSSFNAVQNVSLNLLFYRLQLVETVNKTRKPCNCRHLAWPTWARQESLIMFTPFCCLRHQPVRPYDIWRTRLKWLHLQSPSSTEECTKSYVVFSLFAAPDIINQNTGRRRSLSEISTTTKTLDPSRRQWTTMETDITIQMLTNITSKTTLLGHYFSNQSLKTAYQDPNQIFC